MRFIFRHMEGMILGMMGGWLVGWLFGWPSLIVGGIGIAMGIGCWKPLKRMMRRW